MSDNPAAASPPEVDWFCSWMSPYGQAGGKASGRPLAARTPPLNSTNGHWRCAMEGPGRGGLGRGNRGHFRRSAWHDKSAGVSEGINRGSERSVGRRKRAGGEWLAAKEWKIATPPAEVRALARRQELSGGSVMGLRGQSRPGGRECSHGLARAPCMLGRRSAGPCAGRERLGALRVWAPL